MKLKVITQHAPVPLRMHAQSPPVRLELLTGKYTAGNAAAYAGPYDVTPLADSTTELATNGLRMTDNVRVKKIPLGEVSNPSGTTAIIGGYDYGI